MSMATTLERPDHQVFVSPEIDGVMISLERAHDDELADMYWRAIDLATGPRVNHPDVQARIERILTKLNQEDGFIFAALKHGAELFNTPNLPQDYYSVLGQVKELAQIDN